MAIDGTVEAGWTPWVVAPCFEVAGGEETVVLRQVSAQVFEVPTTFRFAGAGELADVRALLAKDIDDPGEVDAVLDDARTFPACAERTDLASIPRFLTWFENKYGRHTLAAIIHDRLIWSGNPNAGALRSDALADRFFRLMLLASGIPILKAWIMWAAVAMRTRWAARGLRRWLLVAWVLLATIGIATFVAWIGVVAWDWAAPFGLGATTMLLVAVVMPVLSAPLWGRQYVASGVAAVAALWILPPAVFALIGFAVYRVLEAAATRIGVVLGR